MFKLFFGETVCGAPAGSSRRAATSLCSLTFVLLAPFVGACGGKATITPQTTDSNTVVDADPDEGGGNTTDPADSVVGNPGGATNTAVMREAGPAVTANGSGLVNLKMTGCTLSDYFVDALVGGDPISVLVDSGSTTLAVASSLCNQCGAARAYDVSGGTNLRSNISGGYGDGTGWQGGLYRDTVAVGSTPASATPAVDVAFAAITQQQNDFFKVNKCAMGQALEFDGIIGLGPDSLLQGASTSFMTALGASKKLAYDAFAVQTCDIGGSLMLGGYSSATVSELPFFVPLLKKGTWADYYAINMVGAALGGKSLGVSSTRLGSTLVDNGTSGLYFTSALYQAFVQGLRADSAFQANFTSNYISGNAPEPSMQNLSREALDAALPRLQLSFRQANGATATLDLSATNSYLTPVDDGQGNIYYWFIAVRSDAGIILGNTVMRQHVVIFDRANQRVGFAAQKGCSTKVPYGGH